MSILSSIKQGAKNLYGAVKNVLGSSQTASAGMSFPVNPSQFTVSKGILPGTASFTPNTGLMSNGVSFANPITSYGGVSSSGIQSAINSGGLAVQQPRTISGGSGGSNSSLGSPIYGTSAISSYSPTRTVSGGTSSFGLSSSVGTNILSSASAPSVNFPSKPTYNNVGAINNSGVANLLAKDGFVMGDNGQFMQGGSPEDKASQERASLQKDLMSLIQQKDSVQASPEFQNAQNEVNQRKAELAGYTASLNSVVAKRDADLLRLREIGNQEGVTEAVYGGQEATINREAAIRALPIQAQVAAAQGNLELAQDYLTQVTSFQQERINNEWNYRNALVDSISGFLTNEQKIKADAVKKNNDRAWEMQMSNVDAQEKLALEFAKSGQTALINSVYGLNTSSPDFGRQYAQLASRLSGVSGGASGGTLARTLQVLDGFTKLSDLTTSEASKVRDDLFAKGFGSDTPPAWFKDYIQTELRQSLTSSKLQEEWIKYRDGIMSKATKKDTSGGINFDDL